MATATEHAPGFSRSSSMSVNHSPNTPSPNMSSPMYPKRAIHPMPKNRLKSKLSPQQASSIIYPPNPPPISPTLSFSIQEHEAPSQQPRLANGVTQYLHHQDRNASQDQCTCDQDGRDSGDDEVEFDHPDVRYEAFSHAEAAIKPLDLVQRRLMDPARSSKPPAPGSTASSADGYESFENTSNKKKRKIPVSGTSSMHQSQLSAEMASMGIGNNQLDGAADDVPVNGAGGMQQQYSPQSGVPGISGAGRGRYGRHDARVRRPLGSSTMNTINGYHSRGLSRDLKNGTSDAGVENSGGIISEAIRTAAEQGPLTPSSKGRENVSLLQSAATANSTVTPKTQFTFTCESDSASKMYAEREIPTPGYPNGTPTPSRSAMPRMRGVNAQGTQTSPALRNGQSVAASGRPPPPADPNYPPSVTGQPLQHQSQPAAPPPKPKARRNPSREYAEQARNRKKQQQYQNFHHRPKPEDMWICEFCEYEEIFGEPAYAMIRRYEIKDRQERKKAAERRRLLEKAKMKGRKNKKGANKGAKNHAANNNAAPSTNHPQNYDPNLPPPDGEEYFEDEEYPEDMYDAVGPEEHYQSGYNYPPPAPVGTPAAAAAGGGIHDPV